MIGLAMPGTIVLSQRFDQSTGSEPPRARAAPMRPPIRACVDDDGRPSRQVTRFQTIAPASAAKSRWPSRSPGGC